MSVNRSAYLGRGFLLMLSLAMLLLISANSIVSTILDRFFQPNFTSGLPTQDSLAIRDLILDLYFLGYVVAYAFVFYLIGLRSAVIIARDWLALLEFLFLGALIGGFASYLAIIGVNYALYGSSVSVGYSSTYTWFGIIVSLVRSGTYNASVAFAAMTVGTLHRVHALEPGVLP